MSRLPTSNKKPTELRPNRGVKPEKTSYMPVEPGPIAKRMASYKGIKSVGARGKRYQKADKEASKNTRALGLCEAQGVRIECAGQLEDAHIQRRGHLATRHEPFNRACICSAHHRYFTNRPRTWQAFIRMTKPGIWKTTYILSHHTPQIPILNTSAGAGKVGQ